MKRLRLDGLLVFAGCLASCSTPFGDAPGSDGGSGQEGGVVTPGPGQFRFVTGATRTQVVQGKTTSVPISIVRGSGVASDIRVTLTSPPAGVTADPLTISSGSSTGQLSVTVADSFRQGNLDGVVVEGRAVGSDASDIENLPLFVRGKPGTLDTTFAAGGVYEDPAETSGVIQTVATGQNGKIVIGSGSLIRRLNADGSVDETFANPQVTSVFGLAVSTNGIIAALRLVSVQVNPYVSSVINRYTTAGVLDTSFNADGTTPGSVTTVSPWINFFPRSAAVVASDGSIYAGSGPSGILYNSTLHGYGFIRIQPSGVIDPNFYCTGAWTGADNKATNSLTNAFLLPTGGLIFTGYDGGGIGVSRYQPSSCDLDSQYGGVGGNLGVSYFTKWQQLDDSFLESDGSLDLLALINSQASNYSLVHVDPTGKQTSFVSSLAYDSSRAPTGGVTRAPDGRYLVAGQQLPVGNSSMAVAYYNSDLTPDTSVGNQDGIVTIPTTIANAFGAGLRAVYTPDGQQTIVVGVAHRTDATIEHLVVARIWN